jgi:tetratricopeptide (TPR) repeat protein
VSPGQAFLAQRQTLARSCAAFLYYDPLARPFDHDDDRRAGRLRERSMNEKLREALALGRELYAAKEFARAEPYLREVADAEVRYADVYNMLGVIHHDAGQFSKAQSCFEESLRINPSYTEAALNLAVTYNDMGHYQDAKDTYVAALTHSTHPGGKLDTYVLGKLANMYADIAEVFGAAGAFDEAAAELRRGLSLRPTFIDLRLRLAQVYRDSGKLDDAYRELRTIQAQSPDYLPARLHLGLTEFALGRASDAIQTLEEIVVDHPDDKRARLYLDMIRSNQAKKD